MVIITYISLFLPGDSYSYTEILSNALYYVHYNILGTNDSLTLRISDSSQSTDVVIPVVIEYRDDDAPSISPGASMKLTVAEGLCFILFTLHVTQRVIKY